MSFKLLAIRALNGTDTSFIKNLKREVIYSFYKEYEFLDKDGLEIPTTFKTELEHLEVTSVRYTQTVPSELYSVQRKNESENNKLVVNISSIVGKNGSGKSGVLELIYRAIYIVAVNQDLIKDEEYFKAQKEAVLERGTDNGFWDGKLREYNFFINNFKFELYFMKGNEIIKLFHDKEAILFQSIQTDNGFNIPQPLTKDSKDFSFFYSVVINYSLYGLNSTFSGDWLHQLFHKNDGYQTPIVINPFRDEGKIDINLEYALAQSRLLTNGTILLPDEDFIVLDTKIFDSVKLTVIPEKLDALYGASFVNFYAKEFEKENNVNIIILYTEILRGLINYELPQSQLQKLNEKLDNEIYNSNPNNFKKEDQNRNFITVKNTFDDTKILDEDELLYYLFKYAIKKFFKIVRTYSKYKDYLVERTIEKNPERIAPTAYFGAVKDYKAFITELALDKSHISLKLYQALNTVKYGFYSQLQWKTIRNPKKSGNIAFETELKTDAFFNLIKGRTIEEIPAAFFDVEIMLKDKTIKEAIPYSFKSLSSGEQQLIHSIQSILYHIRNVDSVFKSDTKNEPLIKKYNSINLIFDEIELYFHPEYQKDFIHLLLNAFKTQQIDKIDSINILFSTHSPFILSDIPNQNILHLIDGVPINRYDKTFGANVHDLLANDFFMDGFIGEFARNKIQFVINKLNQWREIKNDNRSDIPTTEKTYVFKIIELIGEPIISNKLLEMYSEIFEDEWSIGNEIEYLQERIEKLKQKSHVRIKRK